MKEKNVDIKPVASVTMMEESEDVLFRDDVIGRSIKLKNSDVLANLQQKLCHLHVLEREEMSSEFADSFPDVPGRTDLVCHDVDVRGATPIKQHSYLTNPVKLDFLRKEIEYMLAHDIIEPSQSEWSSPCLLVPKGDGTYRFCTDY